MTKEELGEINAHFQAWKSAQDRTRSKSEHKGASTMPEIIKFATDSFRSFALNESGYMPSAPRCKSCSRFKEVDDGFGGWNNTCNILGSLGLIIVNPEGCCRHHEPKRIGCVPVVEKESST